MLASKCGKHVKSPHNHGVLWIALVLYVPTVHTAMSLLHCVQLNSTEEPVSSVYMYVVIQLMVGMCVQIWYVSGEIKCFTGGHVPLALLAILVLLCCALFIPLSGFLATIEVYTV